MPASVSWLPWVMPVRYLIDGLLTSLFSGQQYFNPLTKTFVSGDAILTTVFNQDSSTLNSWANLAITFGWVILLRLTHLGLTLFTNRDYGRAPGNESFSTRLRARLSLTHSIPERLEAPAAATQATPPNPTRSTASRPGQQHDIILVSARQPEPAKSAGFVELNV